MELFKRIVFFGIIFGMCIWTFYKVNDSRYATQEILKGYQAPESLQATPRTNAVPASTPVPQVTPGTNPPHGQPGHRCDIPVGAKLDQAGKSEAAKSMLSAEQVALNPAHGQPGHRCDIPVGQPLP